MFQLKARFQAQGVFETATKIFLHKKSTFPAFGSVEKEELCSPGG